MNNELKPIHYFSQWVRIIPKYAKIMAQIERIIRVENEYIGILPDTHDIWVRDFMPFQRKDGRFIFYTYAPDYLIKDKKKYITDGSEVFNSLFGKIEDLAMFCEHTNLIIDGGNIIPCVDKNGKDCIIMTDKVFKENNWIKSRIISELKFIFQADIIFIPWDKEEDYGHVDGMVRSLGKGKLMINCYQDIDDKFDCMLKYALSDRFDLCQLSYGKHCSKLSWCHLNYLELNNVIIVPTVGIKSDELALQQIRQYTGKRAIPLKMKEIVKEGGGLHCITWTMREPHRDVIEVLSMEKINDSLPNISYDENR
ncbi:MAG: agmatine deiminase family protein [Bacteroides sp.]|nr:agmatine deiminase family protein [Bacteroides sp.]